ncbi:TonB-dependent receptor domain-containing protein [Erythrobacter sp. MTPC3]|uniref:TonB-dependent receptor domain-containing protein n=1 Tax=Erythrobacter sp. MTPC3 TaxID=3056564 RepID=UPI0036F41F37
MKKFNSNSVKALAFSASAIAFVMAGPVYAQDEGEEEAQEEGADGVVGDEQVDITTGATGEPNTPQGGITVTGSRIVRDTYSSISPLQVISTENQQAIGAFDPAQILQRSEAASGTQIDATFQGFVLDNGPGSQTINLRGLDADRTLVLVNGRRLSPSGVEGAPSNPSINLIPATLVDRYDLLLDGASSVYGSDAVAGVVNAVLRKDFDGLELQVNGDINQSGGGDDFTVSGAWGFTTDRAVFGIGAEYRRVDEVLISDRDFLSGCDTNYEIDQNGNIRTIDVASNAFALEDSGGTVGLSQQPCKISGVVGRIQADQTRVGSIYFDTRDYGVTNINGDAVLGNTGIPFFSDSTNAFGTPVDANGDGIRDVDFALVNTNAAEQDVTFIPEQEYINVFAYGEYTFPGDANLTPFFEAQYSRQDTSTENNGTPQFFPWVPASNAFNPCNIDTNPDGIDCRLQDNVFSGLDTFAGGAFALPSVGSVAARPIPAVRGDRNNVDINQEQYRGVLGLRGDLPFIGSSWSFEVAGVYSRSESSSVRIGIREDRLALALGIDPTADFDGDGVVDNDGDGIADDYNSQPVSPLLAGGACDTSGFANPSMVDPTLLDATCVPVNLFSASLYENVIGDLSTQAERDFLFGERSFDTTYEQKIISGFVTGDLFELPAGPVGVVLGAEWREDSIDSQPNSIASNGLFWGFFADGGAKGSKWIREAYGEIDIPLIAGETLVEELTFRASGRVTDEEFYGTNGTFSLQGGWRPVSPLLIKFSYGTSFRAPNLRENFLRNQSGFGNIFDPCAVPDVAFDSTDGGYQADRETRDPAILANCIREGRDPTSVGIDQTGLNTIQASSTQIFTGGSLDIDPETSRSITTGFAFEESFASGFDFSFNFNYFDIKLKDSIVEPSSQFIVNDCFTRADGNRSPFCDRIEVSSQPADRFLISQINSGFINLNQESVRGIDLNATFGKDVTVGGEVFDIALEFRANRLIERSTLFIDDNGNVDEEDFAGEPSFPSWTGRATLAIDWTDFRFTWQTFYTGRMDQDPDGLDPFSDAFGNGPDGNPTGFFADTCLGGGSADGTVAGDGVFCRDVGFLEEYFEHTASIRWDNGDLRIIAGVTNIFDTDPPLIDTNEVFGISNTPIGNPYDFDGREFFAQLLYRF